MSTGTVLSLRLPESLAKWIRERAEAERRSMAWIVKEMLGDFPQLETNRNNLREMLESLDRRGGLGLDTHEQIRAVLDAERAHGSQKEEGK